MPFTDRNVDDDLDAYDALVALGYRTVPVTLVGDTAVVGFRPEALEAALSAWPPAGGPAAP